MEAKEQALIWRLYLVRQVLQEAILLADEYVPLARMRTVLSLDQAAELLLTSVLPELNVAVKREWPLSKMLEKLCEQKPALQSHRTPMERLRRLRDRVQHDGIVPSSEDTRQMRVQAESFTRDAIREVLQKELEELSPVALIKHDESRRHVESAEEALHSGDYATAVTEAAVGFAIGWTTVKTKEFLSGSSRRDLSETLLRGIGRAAEDAARTIRDAQIREFANEFDSQLQVLDSRSGLRQLSEGLEMLRYGIGLERYVRFLELTPHVYWTLGSEEPHVSAPDDWDPSQQDALFAVDFAMTGLLQLERRVAELPHSEVNPG